MELLGCLKRYWFQKVRKTVATSEKELGFLLDSDEHLFYRTPSSDYFEVEWKLNSIEVEYQINQTFVQIQFRIILRLFHLFGKFLEKCLRMTHFIMTLLNRGLYFYRT